MPNVTTYNAANEWLSRRRNLPAALGSRALALAPEFPAGAKMQAFFSARVTSASILEALREQVQRLAEGEINLATARMEMKTFLASQGIPSDDVGMTDEPPAGVSEDEWQERKKITNIASTRRLDLIFRQNAAMAHAVGRHQVATDPDIVERWPYYRYIARDDRATRPTHAALDNLVLPKTDPFWASHVPPWEFNCRCDVEDTDQAEADDLGGVGQVAELQELPEGAQNARVLNQRTGELVEIPPSPSGYVFRIDAAYSADPGNYDWGSISNVLMRDEGDEGDA